VVFYPLDGHLIAKEITHEDSPDFLSSLSSLSSFGFLISFDALLGVCFLSLSSGYFVVQETAKPLTIQLQFFQLAFSKYKHVNRYLGWDQVPYRWGNLETSLAGF
jgi:hypothetical protein